MMIGYRKEEGRCCTILIHFIVKSPSSCETTLTAILSWKKPKSIPGFKPGLPRQNAITLPLVPPPLPRDLESYFILKTIFGSKVEAATTLQSLKKGQNYPTSNCLKSTHLLSNSQIGLHLLQSSVLVHDKCLLLFALPKNQAKCDNFHLG